MCAHEGEHTHIPHLMCRIRGQLVGVSSLLLPCWFGGLKSGGQAWPQAALHAEPGFDCSGSSLQVNKNNSIPLVIALFHLAQYPQGPSKLQCMSEFPSLRLNIVFMCCSFFHLHLSAHGHLCFYLLVTFNNVPHAHEFTNVCSM